MSQASNVAVATSGKSCLDISRLSPIYLLHTHLSQDEIHAAEEDIVGAGGDLTHDAQEALTFLGKISQKRRALFELRRLQVSVEELSPLPERPAGGEEGFPPKKRRRVSHASTALEGGSSVIAKTDDSATESEPETQHARRSSAGDTLDPIPEVQCATSQLRKIDDVIEVINLSWLYDSKEAGSVLERQEHIIYRGKKRAVPKDSTASHEHAELTQPQVSTATDLRRDILRRAEQEAITTRGLDGRANSYTSTSQASRRGAHMKRPEKSLHLLRETTSEHDASQSADLPDMPEWVQRGSTYSCERSTPANGPNVAFLAELRQIRFARKLTLDEIGFRAYSTAMSAVAAYPYALASSREVLALPGCDAKIATLWAEWSNTGCVQAARDARDDGRLRVLERFYNIWGVGPRTALGFYDRGWRDLDDVVEHGWTTLTREQQIGLKFYDDFLDTMTRAQVEDIERVVAEHARRVRESTGVRTCIVGGYRRGKTAMSDADIMLTHLDERATVDIVQDLVASLEGAGWVPYQLITSSQSSKRGQATLPYRAAGGGHGFDSLDKALIVWQDPHWPGKGAAEPGARNPNVRRRVDIIVAPWSKIGCAVLGWSAGTTFERDLRRYAKHAKNWKFDSSGIRDRGSGKEVDLQGECTDIEDAERKVFEGLGLVYREPWERCSG